MSYFIPRCIIFIVNDLESSGIAILILRSRVLDTVMSWTRFYASHSAYLSLTLFVLSFNVFVVKQCCLWPVVRMVL